MGRFVKIMLVLLFLTNNLSFAQTKNTKLYVGGGLSSGDNLQGLYLFGRITYKSRNIFELRFNNRENLFETDYQKDTLIDLDPRGNIGENTFFYVQDLILTYGYDFLRSKKYDLTLSTGAIYSFVKYRDNQACESENCFGYEDDHYNVFGIPSRLSFTYKTNKRIAYEIGGFYNFSKNDYYGGTFGVSVDLSKRK